MKYGLIGWSANIGLGIQSKVYYDMFKPVKTMVIDNSADKGIPQDYERFPDGIIVKGLPTMQDCDAFLKDFDLMMVAENAPTYYMYERAKKVGIKTVTMPNFEFFDYIRNPNFPRPDLFLPTTNWRFDDIPFNEKKVLPMPSVTPYAKKPPRARNFLHIVGNPAAYDRNGTESLFRCLKFIKSEIKITFKCFDPDYVLRLREQYKESPKNVEIFIDPEPAKNYEDNYLSQDVLILPRRYGGNCLPATEAIGTGMPLIMTDISPNNSWLPKEWLVPAVVTAEFLAHNSVDVYDADIKILAQKIDEMTQDKFYIPATEKAKKIADKLRPEVLKPQYEKIFAELVGEGTIKE